jgi:nucleoside-diphosphate-sugar epimerase
MMIKNIYLIGSEGFIGKAVSDKLIKRGNVYFLNRESLDLTNKSTFKDWDFENSIIIDAIAKIDGDSVEIYQNNYWCFIEFIKFLKINFSNINYIYLSTLSTLNVKVIQENIYVKSKYDAECYLRDNIENHKIIRLSYPFGPTENRNRLVSRLVNKVLNEELVAIKDLKLYLTPIDLFINDFLELLEDSKKEINYLPLPPIRLEDLLKKIFKLTKKKEYYRVEKGPTLEDESIEQITRYKEEMDTDLETALLKVISKYA